MSNTAPTPDSVHNYQESPNRGLQGGINHSGESPTNYRDANNQPGHRYRAEHVWSIIRKHALGQFNPNDTPIKAICPICNGEISVAGLPRPEGEGKEGYVTPCGHTICYECWPEEGRRYTPEGYVSVGRRKCPVCNDLLECMGCGRGCSKQEVPEYSLDVEYVEEAQLTYPETSLVQIPLCTDCLGFVPLTFASWFPHNGQQ